MTGFNVHGARTNQVSQSEMLPLKFDFKLLLIFCFCVLYYLAFPQQLKGVHHEKNEKIIIFLSQNKLLKM